MTRSLRSLLPGPVRQVLRVARQRWRTRNAMTFNEKVRYKIARDRRPLITTFADKVAVRSHVASVGAGCELTALYAVTTDLATVERALLPREFVVKVSHASGGVVVVADLAPPDAPTPTPEDGMVRRLVHPDSLDWPQLVATTQAWLATSYFGYLGEWAYSQVPPRVLVEELLRHGDRLPSDYKLWVFNGRCRVVEVAVGRFGELRELLFTPSWELIPDLPGDEAVAQGVAAPASLERMIAIAERLGCDTDFVRVDLYECDDRIVFGELTNYPGGGFDIARSELDLRLGSYWELPRSYRRLPQGTPGDAHR